MDVILCVGTKIEAISSLKEQIDNGFNIKFADSAQDAFNILNTTINIKLIISTNKEKDFLINISKDLPYVKKLLLVDNNLDNSTLINLVNKINPFKIINKPWDKEKLLSNVNDTLQIIKSEENLVFKNKYLDGDFQDKHDQNRTYLSIIDNYLIASKTDLDGIIIDVSKAMCEITGYTKEELIGKNHNIVRHPDIPKEVYKELWETISAGKGWQGEIKNRKKDGSSYWVKTRVSPSFDQKGNIVGYGSIRVDITDKKRVEELSVTDELTKLYNRRFFNNIFQKEILRATRENKQIGFAIFDIDNFKLYNDNYGHHKGDIVLKEVANCISDNLHRAGDYAFRLGGEEFGILVYDTSLDGFKTLIENIRKAIYNLNIEHNFNGYFEYITASFGGTVFHCNTNTSKNNIYQLADKLLYFSKENGRNRIKIESFESIDQENFDTTAEAVKEFVCQKINFEKNQTKLFNNLIENSNDMIFIFQLEKNNGTKIVYANETAKSKLGYTLEQMQEKDLNEIRKPLESSNLYTKHLKKLKRYQNIKDYGIFITKDGDSFPVEASVKKANYNNTIYNIAIVRDITNRFNYINELEKSVDLKTKELEENISKLKSYKEAMDENSIVTISDNQGIITYANDKFFEVSGFSEDEIIGSNHNIVRHPDMQEEIFDELWETIKSKKVWKGEIKNRKKDGGYYIVQSAIVPILDSNGDILEYIATRYETTELYEKNKEISKLARTDYLTGLGNRFKLLETIKNINQGSIAIIDINNFHEINNFYGEKTGDDVIYKFGELLKQKAPMDCEVFHLQGDGFVILDTKSSQNKFRRKMKKLNNYFNKKTLILDDKIFYLSTTIALSFEEPKLMLSTANLARTYAKENNLLYNVYSYERSLEKAYANNFKWTSKIKQAIEDDRITVFLQPIVDTFSKELIKYEALVRLIDKDGSIVSPYFFLDIAKKSNYYSKITQIVIEKSLIFLKEKQIPISINLTIEDIENRYINRFIFDRLDKCKYKDMITFELVESEGIENFEEVNSFIQKIKSYGCKLAIDDFGTGYSNFEYLLKLNADYIKIDGSIIKEIDKNQDQYLIVKTISDFAKIKNIKLIAEFVSSESIHEKIKSLNIDYSQGYYFGEPKHLKNL